MTINNEIRRKRRDIKKRAALLLGERGNLLRISGALLCALAIVGTAMHLLESVAYLIFSEEMPFYILFIEIAVVILLSLPLCMGLSRMAYRMCRHEKNEISELLRYFEKKRLLNAYRVSFAVFLGVLLQLALAFALGWLIAYAMDGFGNNIIPNETYAFAAVFFMLISGMLPSLYILPNAFFENENAVDAFDRAAKRNSLSPKEIIGFNLSFIPLMLLSALFFGILFIVYTIPLYLVSIQLLVMERSNKKENL